MNAKDVDALAKALVKEMKCVQSVKRRKAELRSLKQARADVRRLKSIEALYNDAVRGHKLVDRWLESIGLRRSFGRAVVDFHKFLDAIGPEAEATFSDAIAERKRRLFKAVS